jgi:hypothetical protein
MVMVIELQVKKFVYFFFFITSTFLSFVALNFYCKVIPKQWGGF